MQITKDLKQIILEAVKKSGFEIGLDEIKLEHPNEVIFGDYSTNIAMVLAKKRI